MLRTLTDAGRMMLARPGRDEPPLEVALRVSGATLTLIAVAGATWGFVRGLAYPPTLWAAVIEGALIFVILGAVPTAALGLAVTVWRQLRRRP